MLQYFKKIFRFGIFDRFGWFHFEIFKNDRFNFEKILIRIAFLIRAKSSYLAAYLILL